MNPARVAPWAWVPLEHLGVRVYPGMFSVAQAHQAFRRGTVRSRIRSWPVATQTIAGFMDLAEAAKHYSCAKTAWVESSASIQTRPSTALDKPA